MPSGPISVDTHLADILAQVRPLSAYPQPLLEAVGLPVAEDVLSPRSVPIFDNSAMDGYAVRYADVASATTDSPVSLPVTGDIHAGAPSAHPLSPGTSMRIMTGAPVPMGADSVVPVEWTDAGVTQVQVRRAPTLGEHVRPIGDDVTKGDVLVRAGDMLDPRRIGLLASVGIDQVVVPPRPRVVVMSTGAELVEPGRALHPGAIFESNSFLLTAAVRATGAVAYRARSTSDDPAAFLEALEDQLVRADLVITSGGVSKGTRDVVKMALRSEPAMQFRQVAMQPGKPQGFGFVGSDRTPLFALPGNPVSTYVSFEVFVAPALRRLIGRSPVSRPLFRARLTEAVQSAPGKRQYLRGQFIADQDGTRVTPVGGAGSHLLAGLGAANALIVLREDRSDVPAGESVPVMLLDREF
ncbi:molybdotransferase-like divisome protein Glp [Nocardioides terrisoli]|uniref:molybdotransferase-like divisome protein Glp n=1 Tax=Nocardioides terrisoli TaxID=3388267 RepID=UPI00287BC91E|nr:gephyrin-like molybdotransferase Glp [Nocardioides marmorisolisilvae]